MIIVYAADCQRADTEIESCLNVGIIIIEFLLLVEIHQKAAPELERKGVVKLDRKIRLENILYVRQGILGKVPVVAVAVPVLVVVNVRGIENIKADGGV
jgi:hypothetical protein